MRLQFTNHALQRMFERTIDFQDIQNVVSQGEVIETYPDDTPFPTRLLLGWVSGKPIHVVAADNAKEQVTVIITVYEPDSERWESPYYRRRRR